MTAVDVAAVSQSDLDHRAQLRRAVIASTVGTTIEWYDFLLYGQMAAIVFGKLYFPASDPLTGTLQAFGSGYAIALYIFGCAIVSVVTTIALPNAKDRDFARDHL